MVIHRSCIKAERDKMHDWKDHGVSTLVGASVEASPWESEEGGGELKGWERD